MFSTLGWAPYDDEIANIHLVDGQDVASIIRIANSEDVHPPGAYVINHLLYRALGSWEAVKIAGGVFNALALAAFIGLGYPKMQPRQRNLLPLILATASTFVLWGASVRWYAYFNPIFVLTAGFLLFADSSRTARTVALGASAVLLFHIGYAAFCAVPVLAALHLGRDARNWERKDWLYLLLATGVALLACAPQAWVFIRVHAHNQGSQTGGPIAALIQVALTLILGNAVFPLAVVPIIYAAAILVLIGFWLLYRRKNHLDRIVIAALMTGVLCMVLSGIGIKARNSVYLLPLALACVSSAAASLARIPYLTVSAAIVLFQCLGVWNVVTHHNTLKGSYNTDYGGAVRSIERWQASCGKIYALNHDPVMTHLLEQAGIPQSSPYQEGAATALTIGSTQCLAVVKTYHGAIAPADITAMYAEVARGPLVTLESRDIGIDSYFETKSRVAHEVFPRAYIHLDIFRAARATPLPDWRKFARVGESRPNP